MNRACSRTSILMCCQYIIPQLCREPRAGVAKGAVLRSEGCPQSSQQGAREVSCGSGLRRIRIIVKIIYAKRPFAYRT